MSRKNTNPNEITQERFFNICKRNTRDINRAKLELKNNMINNIKTNTPLFKEVIKEIGVDYI